MDRIKVLKDHKIIGYCFWNEKTGRTEFNYDTLYVKTGEELSPLIMPLNDTLYFSNPRESLDTFKNLPLYWSIPSQILSGINSYWNGFLNKI